MIMKKARIKIYRKLLAAYISCAEFDDLAPPDMVEELKNLFIASGNNGELKFIKVFIMGSRFPSVGATTKMRQSVIGKD